MDVTVIRKNRRSGKDRRQNTSGYTGTERRSGEDRRQLDNRLNEMMEQGQKVKGVKKKSISPSGNGNIIRRRKNESDKRVA